MKKIFSTIKSFFSFLFFISCICALGLNYCGLPKFLQPTDYIKTVKSIEIEIPYDTLHLNTYSGSIEEFAENFFRYYYPDFVSSNVYWEEKGKLDNGKMIEARYEDAYIEIRAMKNGDYVEIKPIEIIFHNPYGEKYNILNVPVIAAD